MKYKIEIYDKGIEPVALSNEELEEYDIRPTGKVCLCAIFTNQYGGENTDIINSNEISNALNIGIVNQYDSVDIVLLYVYQSDDLIGAGGRYSGTLGFYPVNVGYTPILSIKADKWGDVEIPGMGKGLYDIDSEQREKLFNLIDKAEEIAKQALKRLNSTEEV